MVNLGFVAHQSIFTAHQTECSHLSYFAHRKILIVKPLPLFIELFKTMTSRSRSSSRSRQSSNSGKRKSDARDRNRSDRDRSTIRTSQNRRNIGDSDTSSRERSRSSLSDRDNRDSASIEIGTGIRASLDNGDRPSNGKTKRSESVLRAARETNLQLIQREKAKPQIQLTKLKSPQVRREAAKLAARVKKFQTGLDIAQTGGYKILAGLNVETELQKIFDLADANNDVQMLQQLTNATSFKGKLSLLEPTTEASRALVRITQIFNAVQGDGQYQTIKNNISQLATSATALRAMARDANLLQSLDNAQYLDETRLLRTVDTNTPARPISETTREWHLEQATLMKAYREAGNNPALQKKLALTMLQSFAKAAPLGDTKAEELGAQVSPLLNQPGFYHRSAATNRLLNTVLADYAKSMGVSMGSAHIVDNKTFRDVLAREFVMPGVNTQITDQQSYEQALQALFTQAENGVFPTNKVVLDITTMFQQGDRSPSDITAMAQALEKTFLAKAEQFLKTHPNVDQKKFAAMMTDLQIGAMTTHKGVDVLLTPPFLFRQPGDNDSELQSALLKAAKPNDINAHMEFFSAIEHSMIHSGFRLDPIQARKAWLEVSDPSTILSQQGIQLAELATADTPTPKVFASAAGLINHASFKQFEALATLKNAPPYLKTLPEATAHMLRGLATYNANDGGIDKAMGDQGLDEVLQTAYFRMLNAMASAVDSQAVLQDSDNPPDASKASQSFIQFMNQVEVIQQEIATLVTLIEPHGADAFGNSIRTMLTAQGPNGKPVIPAGLDEPSVQLKPSAMHTLASILSSVEALKQSNQLNVAVLKDHYYESAGAVAASKTYSLSQLDGDDVRDPNGGTRPLFPGSIQGKKPLDIYVADFHHNISLERNHYQVENLQHQVDELYRNNLVADKFTVAIDSTIDFVNSQDIQAFLEHNKERIESGKLNVVLFRSAQKFDMFGMDNYYGGFTVNINDHASFGDFNTRMAAPEDQSKGPSLQGLSHVAVHAPQDMDTYRSALMASTKRFYDALPPGLIWSGNSTSAMQVARTDDPNAVFLDIKFPGNEKASEAFMERLKAFAKKQGLPLTGRASFGFATTNLNLIHGEKTRLTPGLEGLTIQDQYISFFKAVYQQANNAAQTGTQRGLQGEELKAFIAEQIANMPL